MATKAEMPMPSANADLETTWAYLEEGIDYIMTHLRDGLSFAKYMNLYTVASNYLVSSRMHGNLDSVGLGGRTDLMGSYIYNKLFRYFVGHLTELRNTSESMVDEALLRYYAREWDRYPVGAKYVNRIFGQLNRRWVGVKRNGGRNVYELALILWERHVFESTKLVSAVFKLIESQRNGEAIDQDLANVVKKVIDSFVPLGLDGFNGNKVSLYEYKEHFEDPFIAATEEYYDAKSTFLAGTITLPNYLKGVDELLRTEDQIQFYLNANTSKIIRQKCEHLFIQEHLEKMYDGFLQLLECDQVEDLQRMYALLARIPEGLEPLRKKFEEHVKCADFLQLLECGKVKYLQQMYALLVHIPEGLQPLRKKFEDYVKCAGQQAISKLAGKGGANVDSLEPNVYVDALLEVKGKNEHTVHQCFGGEKGFVAALDKGCRAFINRNSATGVSTTKSPELLAKHVDALLRKSNKLAEGRELEDALNQVMVLFKYIDDKDVFQTFYTTKLSKRLIHNVSASDEAEASMISKLKDACGFEYTNKLQRMFTDMSLSKDLTDQFKECIEQSGDTTGGDITFGIMVLSTNRWPIKTLTHEFVIPQEILPTCKRFTQYYQNKHPGRKLTWLWNHSKNELRTNYLNQKYILMTSSRQMAVLIQYNTNDTLSLDELIHATGITNDLLVQILGVLVKAKVLISEETDQYDLNPYFKSKKIRINLNLPINTEVKAEAVDVLNAVEEDRKYVIQATIVRIMKTRKTLKNQALIAEVVSQISQRFTPKIGDIRKAIEMLLEKEYIERAEDQRDTYNYLA